VKEAINNTIQGNISLLNEQKMKKIEKWFSKETFQRYFEITMKDVN
jgi:hypothetical protein